MSGQAGWLGLPPLRSDLLRVREASVGGGHGTAASEGAPVPQCGDRSARRVGLQLLGICLSSALVMGAATPPATGESRSDDAVVRWTDRVIELETRAVLLRLDTPASGGLRRSSWTNRSTGVDVLAGAREADFSVALDGQALPSTDASFVVESVTCQRTEHGALHATLAIAHPSVHIARHYVVHPGLSLIRGWLEITNTAGRPVRVAEPSIASIRHNGRALDLLWMTGAELFGDSWRMRREPVLGARRVLDSYDSPPGATGAALPGDGVDLQIRVNGRAVWPEAGWARSAHSNDPVSHDLALELRQGDRVEFVVARGGHMICDTTEWDPVVAFADGEAFQASTGFSPVQGGHGWSYEYETDGGKRTPCVYDAAPGRYGERWRRTIGVTEPFVSSTEMHPDPEGRAVRVFTCPRAGKVTIRGAARNTGNGGPAGRGFRLGTMAYAPWFCVMDADTRTGAYLGFDCMAHWRAEVAEQGSVGVVLAGYSKDLAPDATCRTPYAFMGLFTEDLDEMGQEILEWQYGHLWDYTREPWFPATRMLGYWMKGTSWGQQGWVGGQPDYESTFRKVFRTADFMRYVGGDTYHRDWGWWDRAGDWNGPDFRTTGRYLREYGMGQLIYAFIYTVDPESSVARAHPEWLANPNTLDQSMPEVVDYQVDLLASFYKRWGPFQWRNDSFPLGQRDGDDSVLLGQQQGFMETLRRFLDAHPDCAFQGVNGGGMGLNWEYLGYASGFQFTDGQAGQLASYYATYLFPPDKINDMPDVWDPAKYDPATWRSLLCTNFDVTGDTFDPAKLEGFRLIVDIYHYLQSRGVAGRWVRVYHPDITGDDPSMYLERLCWDRTRGIIITKHAIAGEVVVRPKGLDPYERYEVSFQESTESFTRTGAQLMEDGIRLASPAAGELIYLNLSDHPGNRVDKMPPTAPGSVVSAVAQHMGVPGVDLRWTAAEDDCWISYYEIARDRRAVGRVAKGCFYFDHSADADPAAIYSVRAVDGAGNASAWTATQARTAPRRQVVRAMNGDGMRFTGTWRPESDLDPVGDGTLLCATAAGASAALTFTGQGLVIHSRLGDQGGLARIAIDDEEPIVVSCYSADEIPQWPLFERQWEAPGEHHVRIECLGQADARGAGRKVWLDAVAVHP